MESDQGFKPPTIEPSARLGMIHLLGWMSGCAVVLAFYRATTDWQQIPTEYHANIHVRQLVFGLLYGTALSGLGLLVWRRLYGRSSFPSMPGHWLLVLGGIGCLVDALTAWIAERTLPDSNLSPYWVHQTLGWSAAAVIGIPYCCGKGAATHWRALAVVATLMLTANAATHALGAMDQLAPYILRRRLFSGSWPYYYGPLARVLGEGLCLSMLPLLVGLDVRAGLRRDWLHWSGVVVITGLALADIAQNLEMLWGF